MAEVAPCGNQSEARRSEWISKMNAKESSLITVPPGFEPKVEDQEVPQEGSKTQEEQSAEALETMGNKSILQGFLYSKYLSRNICHLQYLFK